MIANNYRALQFMREEMGDELTPESVRKPHRIVIERAIADLHLYLQRKISETRNIQSLLHGDSGLNGRQLALLTMPCVTWRLLFIRQPGDEPSCFA